MQYPIFIIFVCQILGLHLLNQFSSGRQVLPFLKDRTFNFNQFYQRPNIRNIKEIGDQQIRNSFTSYDNIIRPLNIKNNQKPTIVKLFEMNSEPNNLCFHSFSAFKRPVQHDTHANEVVAQLEAFAQQCLSIKKKIQLLKATNYLNTTHPLTHILIDFIHSLQIQLQNQSKQVNASVSTTNLSIPAMTSICTITQIPISLLKNIGLLIQESLFIIQCKYLCELSSSMLFQKGLAETFRLCFISINGAKNNKINFVSLDGVLNNLLNADYRKIFMNNIYTLLSGTPVYIQRTNLQQNLKCVINNIGKVFTQKTNLITRNLKNVKKSKFISEIVSHSVKTICNYKNQQFINEETTKITNNIFGQHNVKLTKQDFATQIQHLLTQLTSSSSASKQGVSSTIYTLFLYVDLLRVQSLMVHDTEFITNVQKQKQINSSNFYTQQMQKLLKKCPYNGDQCCDCKKCQCVRRNRESAKLSQEKKRNAVEQLDPMKRRIQELERRNKQLEQQNRILRGIVSQFKNCSNNRSAFSSTIQTVSKALNNY